MRRLASLITLVAFVCFSAGCGLIGAQPGGVNTNKTSATNKFVVPTKR